MPHYIVYCLNGQREREIERESLGSVERIMQDLWGNEPGLVVGQGGGFRAAFSPIFFHFNSIQFIHYYHVIIYL